MYRFVTEVSFSRENDHHSVALRVANSRWETLGEFEGQSLEGIADAVRTLPRSDFIVSDASLWGYCSADSVLSMEGPFISFLGTPEHSSKATPECNQVLHLGLTSKLSDLLILSKP